jgi:hypothetical protein
MGVADGGATWEDRLGPQLYVDIAGTASDDSVIGFAGGESCALDRVMPTGTSWQSLGQAPVAAEVGCGVVEIVAGSGDGDLWYLPAAYAYDNQIPTAAQRLPAQRLLSPRRIALREGSWLLLRAPTADDLTPDASSCRQLWAAPRAGSASRRHNRRTRPDPLHAAARPAGQPARPPARVRADPL